MCLVKNFFECLQCARQQVGLREKDIGAGVRGGDGGVLVSASMENYVVS